LDAFVVSDAARYAGPFAPPAAKPVADPHVRILLNFEADGPFLVGRKGWGYGTEAYILPDSPDAQGGGFRVEDVQFMGPASGPCFFDTILSGCRGVSMVQPWVGVTLRGATYYGDWDSVAGTAGSVGWMQAGQSMSSAVRGLRVGSPGIPVVLAGPVGGSYSTVAVTPLPGCYLSLYVRDGHDAVFVGGQVDDEGQGGSPAAVVSIDGGTLTLVGVQLVRQTAGPVVHCCRGGTVHTKGGWLAVSPAVADRVAELVHFSDPPFVTATVEGPRLGNPPGPFPPLTATPRYVIWTEGGMVRTPGLVTLGVSDS
jgi:hypothetical protein